MIKVGQLRLRIRVLDDSTRDELYLVLERARVPLNFKPRWWASTTEGDFFTMAESSMELDLLVAEGEE